VAANEKYITALLCLIVAFFHFNNVADVWNIQLATEIASFLKTSSIELKFSRLAFS
jgi:hypothetical protein